MDTLISWLKYFDVNLASVVATIVVLILAPPLILALRKGLRNLLRAMQPKLHLPFEMSVLIVRVASGGAWLIAGLLLLHFWGVDVGGIWTVLISAATLIGVGFIATWAMMSNATANIFVTIWRPFQFGQTVEFPADNVKGQVIDRNMMFTTLRESSGSVLFVPNNFFFQKMFRVTGAVEELSTVDVLGQTVPDADRRAAP